MSAVGTLLTNVSMGMAGSGTLQAQTSGVPTPNGGASGNRFVILANSGYMAYAMLDNSKRYSLVLVPNQGQGIAQSPVPLPNMQGNVDQSKYYLTMYSDPSLDVIYVTVGIPSSLWIYKYSVNVIANTLTLINVIQPLNNTNLGGSSQAFQDVNINDELSMGVGISQLGVNGSINTSYVLGYLYNPMIGTTENMTLITSQNNIVDYQNIVTSLATVNNVFTSNGQIYLLWGNLEHQYTLYNLATDGSTITANKITVWNITTSPMYGDFQYQPVALDVASDDQQYIYICKAMSPSLNHYNLEITKFDLSVNSAVWDIQTVSFTSSQVAFISAECFNNKVYVSFEEINSDSGDIQYAMFDQGSGIQVGSTTRITSNDGVAAWSPKLGIVGNLLYVGYTYSTQPNYFQPTSIYFYKLDQTSALPLKAKVVGRSIVSAYLSTPLHLQGSSLVKSKLSGSLSKDMGSFGASAVARSLSSATLTISSSGGTSRGIVNIINLRGQYVITQSLKGSV